MCIRDSSYTRLLFVHGGSFSPPWLQVMHSFSPLLQCTPSHSFEGEKRSLSGVPDFSTTRTLNPRMASILARASLSFFASSPFVVKLVNSTVLVGISFPEASLLGAWLLPWVLFGRSCCCCCLFFLNYSLFPRSFFFILEKLRLAAVL